MSSSAPPPNSKKKVSPFFTTSDLLETINSSLQDDKNDPDSNGYFQLQRRLPDGQTTRKATTDEVAAADFQSKLQQAAAQTADLSPKEKIEWSKKLRAEGNILFQEKDYISAMDMYLTCLVGLNNKNNNETDGTNHTSNNDINYNKCDEDNNKQRQTANIQQEELEKEIQLPVLMNLSMCALKLKMYKKCVQFCNFALELTTIGKRQPKVYFLRGKATMLVGTDYDSAQCDFDMSLSLLSLSDDNNIVMEKNVVEKEKIKLERLKYAAKENEKKCKEGMKSILGGSIQNIKNTNTEKSSLSSSSAISTEGLYSDRNNRSYSTLRSPNKKKGPQFQKKKSNSLVAEKTNRQQGIITPTEFIVATFILSISVFYVLTYITNGNG